MPRVSVCSSVKNQSVWLKDMIATVVAQTFTDWELVLVDDGSTEDIKSVVDSFNDPRIKLTVFPENRGIPHGINYAFKAALGDYIQPLAADERLEPHKLEMQVKFLDEHENIGAVWGLPREGEMGERPEWEQYFIKAANRSRVQWLITMLNVDSVPLGGCSALWRREIHDKCGYFREDLQPFVDHEFYCRIIENFDIRILPYRWAISIPNPEGISYGNTKEKRDQAVEELARVQELHKFSMTDPATKVTVAVPVKNMAWCILDALNSVVAQTHKDWELLVVDDGSTDKTADVVDIFINTHPDNDIKLFKFPENMGDRAACNYMITKAQGDYFMCLSADDLIDPTLIERCVAIFQQNAQLEFIASQSDFIAEDGGPHTEKHPAKEIEKASNKTKEAWISRLFYGNVYFGAGMFRTKTLTDLGGWKAEYGCLSDYEMYLAVLQRGNIHIIEEDLTHTRIHGSNMSMNVDSIWLRKTYTAIRKRYFFPRRKLLIATPFYETKGFSPYIGSMARMVAMLTRMGLQFEYMLPSGDAYVHRVKNTILSTFMEDDECTDLLLIDSDMEWPAEALAEMLMCQEEIIVGSYPMKNNWNAWTSKPFFEKSEGDEKYYATERKLPNGGLLIKGQDLAGGFMLFKRGGLQKYMDAYPDLRYTDPTADLKAPHRIYTEFFTAGPLKRPGETMAQFWGEDRYFSYRLKEIGVDWWIFANIDFGHWGVGGWHGNFKKHLDMCKDSPVPINLNTGVPDRGDNSPGKFTPPQLDDITIPRIADLPLTPLQRAAGQ